MRRGDKKREGADWLAWSLQFIFGLLVGAMLGAGLVRRRRMRGWWIAAPFVPMWVVGVALLIGAIAARYGDRLWYRNANFRMGAPQGHAQSPASIRACLWIGGAGVILMVAAVCFHLLR